MKVMADDLVKRMWLAVQSCTEGLEAAGDLLRSGRYASSAALAMAAQDELGKARLLRALWARAQAGGGVTVDEVRAVCGHSIKRLPQVTHVKKQEASLMGVTLCGEPGGSLAKAITRQSRAVTEVGALRAASAAVDDPALVAAYAEWQAAKAEIDQEVQATVRRAPSDRHALRNRGLYLDVAADHGRISWKRPNEIGVGEAEVALEDALNDYRLVRENLQPHSVEHTPNGPALVAALAAWPEKPDLPQL